MRNELLYVGANNKLVDMDDSTNITLKYKNNIFTGYRQNCKVTQATLLKTSKHSEESVCISSRRPAILPIFRCFILP